MRLLVERFSDCFRFYRDVLGFETDFADDGGPYAEFRLGGDKFLGLFAKSAMATAVGNAHLPANVVGQDAAALVLFTKDVDAAYERIRYEHGVRFVTGPADRPEWGLRTAHLRDPDGNLIELWSPYGEGFDEDA